MSTCPDSSLISVYLDDELPEPYKARFEAHLASCTVCSEKLAKEKKMRDLLHADPDCDLLSDAEMEQSFERLQARMTYHHVTKKSDNVFKFVLKKIAPAVAAAAVFAVILPLRFLNNNEAVPQLFTPIAQSASFFPAFSTKTQKNAAAPLSEANKAVRTTVSSSTMTTTVNLEDTNLATIDIFRPDFSDDVIHITIDLSSVSGLSKTNETSIMDTPVSISSEGMK